MTFSLFSDKKNPAEAGFQMMWRKVGLSPVLIPPSLPHLLLARHEGFLRGASLAAGGGGWGGRHSARACEDIECAAKHDDKANDAEPAHREGDCGDEYCDASNCNEETND